jgi:cytochrome b subunit of formate dehydrogenase
MSGHGHGEGGGRTFVRFNASQRIEHFVNMFGFFGLCLTGLPQRYNGAAWADWMIQTMGGVDVVRGIHRTFGVLLIVQTVYHFMAMGYVLFVKKAKWSMMPGLQDLRDAGQMVMYFLFLRKERAKFDRYDFRQKVEYLALIWGTFLMIATGLAMWYPIEVAMFLPGEVIPASKAAHGGEGLLAFASILLWHMYSAHLSPDVFPFDWTIFDGKISEERMHHEHPLELERILAAEKAAAEKAAASAEPAAETKSA